MDKEKRKQYAKEYRQRPNIKSKMKLWQAEYYQKHKDKLSELNRQWAKNHPSEIRKFVKKYYATEKGRETTKKEKVRRRLRYAENGKTEKCRMSQKNNNLKTRFGITINEYNIILEQQKGLCAICGNPETAIESKTNKIKNLSVDHNHRTGKARKLLCTRCNVMIGYSRESIEILSNAIRYLSEFKE